MRTTVRLSDSLLEKAKKAAVERHTTLTDLIEQGLQYVISLKPSSKKYTQDLPTFKGGVVREGVDLNDTSKLMDIMDGLE